MKTTENSNYRLFSDAGRIDKSSVYSKHFNFSFNENQGFVVPWQLTEERSTGKVEEKVIRYNHF